MTLVERGRILGTAILITLPLVLLSGCDSAQQETPEARAQDNKPVLATDSDSAAARSTASAGSMVGKLRPEFSLRNIEDNKLSNIKEWDGKVLVINFWASWCPPCRREMPMFVRLQEQYADKGLQFIGIAIDEPDQVRDFMDTMMVNYPMLIGAQDAIDVARIYGNRFGALPYTVIVDRKGIIRKIQHGELLRETALKSIHELL